MGLWFQVLLSAAGPDFTPSSESSRSLSSASSPLYSALAPSPWVSRGFCLTTAGPICPCVCLKPLPFLPVPPGKGAKLGDAWRPGSSWVPGEEMGRDSCSLSNHPGARSPGMSILEWVC